MTREEKQKAIDTLKISVPIKALTQEEFNEYIQILNKIMDWLEQDLGVDAVSRADAIKAMQDKAKKLTNEDTINGLCGAVAILYDLPSVTPIRPKGHWISRWHPGHDLHFHVCSECNEEFSCDMETGISIDDYRYCPNCGADMREVEE